MALLAEGLPVALVPEEGRVAAVRADVVDDSGLGVDAAGQAADTQRMGREVLLADPPPLRIIAAAGGRAHRLRMQRLVSRAVAL